MGSCLSAVGSRSSINRQKCPMSSSTRINKKCKISKKSKLASKLSESNDDKQSESDDDLKKPHTVTNINLSGLQTDDNSTGGLSKLKLSKSPSLSLLPNINKRKISTTSSSLYSSEKLNEQNQIKFKIRPTQQQQQPQQSPGLSKVKVKIISDSIRKRPQSQWTEDLQDNTRQRLKEKRAVIRKLYESVYQKTTKQINQSNNNNKFSGGGSISKKTIISNQSKQPKQQKTSLIKSKIITKINNNNNKSVNIIKNKVQDNNNKVQYNNNNNKERSFDDSISDTSNNHHDFDPDSYDITTFEIGTEDKTDDDDNEEEEIMEETQEFKSKIAPSISS